MLLSLFLGVYMTTAKAAFVNDLTDAAPSDNASGKRRNKNCIMQVIFPGIARCRGYFFAFCRKAAILCIFIVFPIAFSM